MATNDKGAYISKFELPRLDWHDEISVDIETGEIIGRLYKDALIEDFNAIEDKAMEIQGLDIFDISIPEPSDVSYPDSTLDSDDNQIINLKSFVNILGLNGYPFELTFSGATCTKCKYFCSTSKHIRELTNVATGASASKPYIYLNPTAGTITSNATPIANTGTLSLIGFYINGKVISMRSQLYPTTSTIKGS